VRALALVRDLLVSDPTDGEKYILFVTDGEPDYCGDGNPLCPVDGVVYQLQELYEQGIKTFVFGLQTVRSAVPASTLQAWANAGAGEPVAYLQRDNQVIQPIDIFYQCNPAGDPNSRGWKEDHTAAGRPTSSAPAEQAATRALLDDLDVPTALSIAEQEGGQTARTVLAILGLT